MNITSINVINQLGLIFTNNNIYQTKVVRTIEWTSIKNQTKIITFSGRNLSLLRVNKLQGCIFWYNDFIKKEWKI